MAGPGGALRPALGGGRGITAQEREAHLKRGQPGAVRRGGVTAQRREGLRRRRPVRSGGAARARVRRVSGRRHAAAPPAASGRSGGVR